MEFSRAFPSSGDNSSFIANKNIIAQLFGHSSNPCDNVVGLPSVLFDLTSMESSPSLPGRGLFFIGFKLEARLPPGRDGRRPRQSGEAVGWRVRRVKKSLLYLP